MKVRKVPMRTCIVTKEKLPKQDLIRIVKFNDEVSIDLTGKQNGKGCYLKKDSAVIDMAKKKNIISRVLEIDIKDEFYDEIKKYIV